MGIRPARFAEISLKRSWISALTGSHELTRRASPVNRAENRCTEHARFCLIFHHSIISVFHVNPPDQNSTEQLKKSTKINPLKAAAISASNMIAFVSNNFYFYIGARLVIFLICRNLIACTSGRLFMIFSPRLGELFFV